MGNGTDTSGSAFPLAIKSGLQVLGVDGVGLIGGSIAAAAKARQLCDWVIGFGRSKERLEAAKAAGLIDEVATNYRAASSVDLQVCCLPVDRIPTAIRNAALQMRPGTVATDAGSVKAAICDAIGARPAERIFFVGSHPLAGSEKQGFEHADINLFSGRTCVVTPGADTDPAAVAFVMSFWRSLGCHVVPFLPCDHDSILARTSHLPHAIAAALATGLAEGDEQLAASGFRDTTRIAGGDPRLWTSILLANRESISQEITAFIERCRGFKTALDSADSEGIERFLAEGKQRRDAFLSRYQSSE